jgi:hypothetical protein
MGRRYGPGKFVQFGLSAFSHDLCDGNGFCYFLSFCPVFPRFVNMVSKTRLAVCSYRSPDSNQFSDPIVHHSSPFAFPKSRSFLLRRGGLPQQPPRTIMEPHIPRIMKKQTTITMMGKIHQKLSSIPL